MANLTLNLFNLGCASRRDIILRRSEDGEKAIIYYDGHVYHADWKRFGVDNFTAELTVVE